MMADHYANFATTVQTAAVEPLQRIRTECKEYACRIAKELGKISDEVDTQRQESTKAIEHHTKGINQVNTHHLAANDDPFISSVVVFVVVGKLF
jgi:hypothetical protein